MTLNLVVLYIVGSGSSMSCAGSQDPLDLDMRAMREAALGSHKGERSNKPNDSPDSNYGSSLSSDQTVRMCMSPMPLETVEDAEFKWKECDAAENGLNEKNSIDDSQEDRIVQVQYLAVSFLLIKDRQTDRYTNKQTDRLTD